jgi:hypothetical protein
MRRARLFFDGFCSNSFQTKRDRRNNAPSIRARHHPSLKPRPSPTIRPSARPLPYAAKHSETVLEGKPVIVLSTNSHTPYIAEPENPTRIVCVKGEPQVSNNPLILEDIKS